MMPAINFAGSRKGKASVLLFLCAGLNHSQKPKKRIYRRDAEKILVLLAAPQALLTK
jgi:hypothetical protein